MKHVSNLINRNKKNNITNKENTIMQNKNANERKVTLEVNGIAPDAFISLKLANGETIQVNANALQKLSPEEAKKIFGASNISDVVGGDINNPLLCRRWVMAQWFRQYNDRRGYARAVSALPQTYQWKMLYRELNTLATLETKDYDYFNERTVFFNLHTIADMLNEYADDLERKIEHMKKKRCKHIPYVTLAGENIFVEDVNKKIIAPLHRDIYRFECSRNYMDAYHKYLDIKRNYIDKYHTNNRYVGATFKECYKGAGAYYTLQNMVLYHGCKLTEYDCASYNPKPVGTYTGQSAYQRMRYLLFNTDYGTELYRWTGMLRQCIEDNNFSFSKEYLDSLKANTVA